MSTELDWPDKNPDEVLDYAVFLGDDLETGENAVGAMVQIKPSGDGELCVAGHSPPIYADGTPQLVIWLSGGVPGRIYLLKVDVATDQARTYEYLITLKMGDVLAKYPQPCVTGTDFGVPVTWNWKWGARSNITGEANVGIAEQLVLSAGISISGKGSVTV